MVWLGRWESEYWGDYMEPLTPEQQKFVADNHNLIYGYCVKHCLDKEEYYGECALALCYAAQHYDPAKGTFGTYAYLCMGHEIIKTRSFAARKKRSCIKVSIDEKPLDRQGYRLEEILPDKLHNDESWLTEKVCYQDAIEALSEKDRELVSLLYNGYSQGEIAKKYGVTRSCINLKVQRIKKKIKETA